MNKFEKNPNPRESYSLIVRKSFTKPVRKSLWRITSSKTNWTGTQSFYKFMNNWSADWNMNEPK